MREIFRIRKFLSPRRKARQGSVNLSLQMTFNSNSELCAFASSREISPEIRLRRSRAKPHCAAAARWIAATLPALWLLWSAALVAADDAASLRALGEAARTTLGERIEPPASRLPFLCTVGRTETAPIREYILRQQAEAIVAARHKIVEGAVSMVEMALNDLAGKQIVELDEEKKATMVSNLMVVLCSDKEVTPVVNTGTLYQ